MASAASRVINAVRQLFGRKPVSMNEVPKASAQKEIIISKPKEPIVEVKQDPVIVSIMPKIDLVPTSEKSNLTSSPIQLTTSAIEPKPKTPYALNPKPIPTHDSAKQSTPTSFGGGVEIRKPVILKVVKAHMPMIKFRKGSPPPAAIHHVTETTFTPVVATSAPSSDAHKWHAGQVVNLEWWQTPSKFKRRSVDDLEVDLINSGGADKMYQ